MGIGILLGLLTAVLWGTSDFVARFAAHRIGALRTSFYMQLAGLLMLSIFLPWIGGWGHLRDGSGWRPWALGALAGGVLAMLTRRGRRGEARDLKSQPGPSEETG